ncbi:MAG: hypothetical protein AAF917_13140 [Pseudomonadota bacterium]
MKLTHVLVAAVLSLPLGTASAKDVLSTDYVQLSAPSVTDGSRFTVRWDNRANARLGEMQYLEESRDGKRFYTVYSGLGGTKTFMNRDEGTYLYRVRWQFCFATYCHSLYSDSVEVEINKPE